MLVYGDLQRGETLANTIANSKSKKAYIPRLYAFLQGEKLLCKLSKRKFIFLFKLPLIYNYESAIMIEDYTKHAFGIIRTNQYREVYLMANTQPKYKVFSLVTYAEPDQINEILEKQFSDGVIDCYAFSYHDKDLKDDGTRKEPHYHIVLQCTVHRTANSVRNWFKGTTDYKGERATTTIECTHIRTVKGNEIVEKVDRHGATCYLVHEDKDGNPLLNKYHYSWDIVTSKNLDILMTPVKRGRSPKEDKSFEILDRVLNGDNFYDLAKEYGRDFILHWHKYRDLCQYVFGRSLEEEEKRLERERIDYEIEALAKACERMTIEEKLRKENEILKAQLIVSGIIFNKDKEWQ